MNFFEFMDRAEVICRKITGIAFWIFTTSILMAMLLNHLADTESKKELFAILFGAPIMISLLWLMGRALWKVMDDF